MNVVGTVNVFEAVKARRERIEFLIRGLKWAVKRFEEAFPALDVIATDTARKAMITSLVDVFANRPDSWYAVTANRYDSIYNAGVDLSGRPFTPARRAMFDMLRNSFRSTTPPKR